MHTQGREHTYTQMCKYTHMYTYTHTLRNEYAAERTEAFQKYDNKCYLKKQKTKTKKDKRKKKAKTHPQSLETAAVETRASITC